MPHDDDLDDSVRILVETIVKYDVIAEQCAAHLHQYDQALVGRLWEEGQAIFMGNSVKLICYGGTP